MFDTDVILVFCIFKWISTSDSHLRHVNLMAGSNHSFIEYAEKSRIVEMWRWFVFQLLEEFNAWINIFDLYPNSRIRILNCTSITFVTSKTKEMNYNINKHIRDILLYNNNIVDNIVRLLCEYTLNKLNENAILYIWCFYFADCTIEHISTSKQSYLFVCNCLIRGIYYRVNYIAY